MLALFHLHFPSGFLCASATESTHSDVGNQANSGSSAVCVQDNPAAKEELRTLHKKRYGFIAPTMPGFVFDVASAAPLPSAKGHAGTSISDPAGKSLAVRNAVVGNGDVRNGFGHGNPVAERHKMDLMHEIAPPVHQWVAGEAYQIAKTALPAEAQAEMDLFIPGKTQISVDGHSVPGYDATYQVIKGSKEEDEIGTLPYFNHFWDQDGGPDGGIPSFGSENAYQRASRFWDDAMAYYADGNKASAYHTLGRITHLLTDMSVPAHVHNDDHPPGWLHDSYEKYMAEWDDDVNNAYNYHQWAASGTAMSKTNLFHFFNDMADSADDYDSNDADGELPGHSEGHNDKWETQAGWWGSWDVSYAEARNHGNVLMPLAMQYVAGLYIHFWDETRRLDSDADGVPDWWELDYFGGIGMLPDAHGDADGFTNMEEYIAGSDPTNSLSYFVVSNIVAGVGEAGVVIVEWEPVIADRLYNVHWTDNLTNGFGLLEGDIEFPQNNHTDTVHGAEAQGFYKVDVRLE
ncbi:MAG: hypothetical protein ABFR33_07130 [Verrucomicrobiota bacterium]